MDKKALEQTEIQFTEEQNRAINYVVSSLQKPTCREIKLGGYAGTGKTTVSKEIISRLEGGDGGFSAVSVAAFTGKACSVLRRKGISQAQTIHSLIYKPVKNKDGSVTWIKNPYLDADVVLVDEASMVSTELYKDLTSFKGTKFIWVGDPGQLEPVGENPQLMRSPDVTLEKIHRQAEGNPIILLANCVRHGDHPRKVGTAAGGNKNITFVDKCVSRNFSTDVDQVICGFNRTRIQTNDFIRKQMGCSEPLVLGEKLICLKNNRELGVFNGLQLRLGRILEEQESYWLVSLRDDLGEEYEVKLNRQCLELHGWDEKKLGRVPFQHCLFDYSYAITCHKAQGSEWDRVLVIDESFCGDLWDPKRWRYTAITRAAKELIYAS